MAQAIEDKKKSDPEEVGDSNPQGPGESGIEETTTARKIEGALEEITRSVAGVAELIQENGSPEIPEKEDIEDIEKQLQELNTLTQPISEPASASLTQIPEDHSPPPAEEKVLEEPVAPIQETPSQPMSAQEEPATEPIEDEGLEKNLSEPLPAQEDTAQEGTESLIPQGLLDSHAEEEISPVGSPDYSNVLVAWHDRGGKVTEEYRSLRTNLLAKCQADRFCLMVTSARAQEGKTVSCLNLAFVMAERVDHRAIVVDLNLRNGQMAKLLNARPGPGVADYLRGAAELSEILQPTAYPNLFFIPAGRMENHQSSELLSRSELKRMIDWLRNEYDYVLLDTPAVNQSSDAGVAGLATGEALLVVRSNKTPREAVTQAINGLRNANVNLVGILMTHWRQRFFN